MYGARVLLVNSISLLPSTELRALIDLESINIMLLRSSTDEIEPPNSH